MQRVPIGVVLMQLECTLSSAVEGAPESIYTAVTSKQWQIQELLLVNDAVKEARNSQEYDV